MKFEQANQEVRRQLGRIPVWRVAKGLGISESTLFRWLRHELEDGRKNQLLEAVAEIKSEAEGSK